MGLSNDSGVSPGYALRTTERGTVRGKQEDGVVAFRGISYAASPVGENRLAPPKPHEGWTDIRDAVAPGPAVPQGPSRLEMIVGGRTPDWNEDGCLNLNVWAPADAANAPVLVYFHGGGWSSGSGGWDWYDGARLAALGGIVVVTANYRLGPLGYIYLPDHGVVNIGGQDQVAALRWVHTNIAAFGGDPGAITVGGQSAGAFNAVEIAASEDTGALVRRVIAQSGPWGLPKQDPALAAEHAAAYLDSLGVARGADPVRALRGLPVERLLVAYGQLAAAAARPYSVAPAMYPVAHGEPPGPLEMIADGTLGGKDLLIGSTTDEMTAFLTLHPDTQDYTADVVARTTEEVFGAGVTQIAGHSAAQGTPAYVYRFERRPPDDPGRLGATHCSDLPFLFGTFAAWAGPMRGDLEPGAAELARAYGGAFAAFVATGSPDGEGLAAWHPYGPAAEVMTFDTPGRTG